MLRETERLLSYRLGSTADRGSSSFRVVRCPNSSDTGSRFLVWSRSRGSKIVYTFLWRCRVDELLQVSHCWNSVWLLVEFLSQSRFMRLRKLAKRDHELCHVRVCLSVRPSVCPSVRLSVRPPGTKRLPLDGFSWNLIFEYFFGDLWRKFNFR
jgi:hypothetical protein